MSLSVGAQAPTFTLKTKNEEGLQDVSLSDTLGEKKTVLLFFPFAFTDVCMGEMCSVRDDLSSYDQLNAQVYGISVDSPFTQEVMAKQENINFPLLSDFNKEVSQAYDVMYEDLIGFAGVSKRSAFVIDEGGAITFAWSSDDPHQVPDFDAIKAALA